MRCSLCTDAFYLLALIVANRFAGLHVDGKSESPTASDAVFSHLLFVTRHQFANSSTFTDGYESKPESSKVVIQEIKEEQQEEEEEERGEDEGGKEDKMNEVDDAELGTEKLLQSHWAAKEGGDEDEVDDAELGTERLLQSHWAAKEEGGEEDEVDDVELGTERLLQSHWGVGEEKEEDSDEERIPDASTRISTEMRNFMSIDVEPPGPPDEVYLGEPPLSMQGTDSKSRNGLRFLRRRLRERTRRDHRPKWERAENPIEPKSEAEDEEEDMNAILSEEEEEEEEEDDGEMEQEIPTGEAGGAYYKEFQKRMSRVH